MPLFLLALLGVGIWNAPTVTPLAPPTEAPVMLYNPSTQDVQQCTADDHGTFGWEYKKAIDACVAHWQDAGYGLLVK